MKVENNLKNIQKVKKKKVQIKNLKQNQIVLMHIKIVYHFFLIIQLMI